MSECSTRAIIASIRIPDFRVRERAISPVKNALNITTPTGVRADNDSKHSDRKSE
jgi:hypothetical protein